MKEERTKEGRGGDKGGHETSIWHNTNTNLSWKFLNPDVIVKMEALSNNLSNSGNKFIAYRALLHT